MNHNFKVGDKVALLPDCEHSVKDHGVVVALEGPFHVLVRWQGTTAECAHVDRIALRRGK